MKKDELYIVIAKLDKNSIAEHYVDEFFYDNRNMFCAEFIHPRSKISDKFIEMYGHSLEDAKRLMKRYLRYNKKKTKNGWYNKSYLYLRRASKMQIDYNKLRVKK